jgi:purine-binding chemotaxis protein CheW
MEIIKRQQKSLGELLTHAGIITKEQLEEALAEQKKTGEPLGKILVRRGSAKDEDIINVLKGMLVVVFELNREMFGIEIVYAKEILNFKKITPLPAMPPYIKGMVSIRDRAIPVISLNELIFKKKDEVTGDTKIIIIENRDDRVGVIVDRMAAVKNFQSENFENLGRSSITAEKKYIEGIIKDKGNIITLIKIDYLFAGHGNAGKN